MLARGVEALELEVAMWVSLLLNLQMDYRRPRYVPTRFDYHCANEPFGVSNFRFFSSGLHGSILVASVPSQPSSRFFQFNCSISCLTTRISQRMIVNQTPQSSCLTVCSALHATSTASLWRSVATQLETLSSSLLIAERLHALTPRGSSGIE